MSIVPQANRIGEENKGWTYAKYLLGNERTSIGQVGGSKRELKKLKDIARGERMDENRRFRDKVALLEIDLMGLELSNLRMIASLRGGRDPGAEASILKIKGSEIQQRIAELAFEALGPLGVAVPARGARGRLERRDRRSRLRAAGCTQVFQHAEDLDLRRIQRNSTQYSRQGSIRVVKLRICS